MWLQRRSSSYIKSLEGILGVLWVPKISLKITILWSSSNNQSRVFSTIFSTNYSKSLDSMGCLEGDLISHFHFPFRNICLLYNVGADHMYINNLFISNIGNFFLGSLVQPETNIYFVTLLFDDQVNCAFRVTPFDGWTYQFIANLRCPSLTHSYVHLLYRNYSGPATQFNI